MIHLRSNKKKSWPQMAFANGALHERNSCLKRILNVQLLNIQDIFFQVSQKNKRKLYRK